MTKNNPRDPNRTAPYDTRLDTHPLAVMAHGHTWLDKLHDPQEPIYVADTWLACDRDRFDARCPGCDVSNAVTGGRWRTTITSGHEAGCWWFTGFLARAVECGAITAESDAEFRAGLAVTGTGA